MGFQKEEKEEIGKIKQIKTLQALVYFRKYTLMLRSPLITNIV